MFYLGTHMENWLATAGVPLFVSDRRLRGRRILPRAAAQWALDSGSFTELHMYGRYTVSVRGYVLRTRRYRDEIGSLDWAAPQDWMCEPFMLAKTGLSVAEHQVRTVGNYLELMASDPSLPWAPVVQGYTLTEYDRCVDLYEAAGVDLAAAPVTGLGSVCRRQNTDHIGRIVVAMHDRGIRNLHGFGCKAGAIKRYGDILNSSDSLAWSYAGRRRGTCLHLKSRCANHLHYALDWRARLLATSPGGTIQRELAL